jgi:hypothetical protein
MSSNIILVRDLYELCKNQQTYAEVFKIATAANSKIDLQRDEVARIASVFDGFLTNEVKISAPMIGNYQQPTPSFIPTQSVSSTAKTSKTPTNITETEFKSRVDSGLFVCHKSVKSGPNKGFICCKEVKVPNMNISRYEQVCPTHGKTKTASSTTSATATASATPVNSIHFNGAQFNMAGMVAPLGIQPGMGMMSSETNGSFSNGTNGSFSNGTNGSFSNGTNGSFSNGITGTNGSFSSMAPSVFPTHQIKLTSSSSSEFDSSDSLNLNNLSIETKEINYDFYKRSTSDVDYYFTEDPNAEKLFFIKDESTEISKMICLGVVNTKVTKNNNKLPENFLGMCSSNITELAKLWLKKNNIELKITDQILCDNI